MPRPQVEGCSVDLTDLRYFFRKQRICEHHARADVVTDAAGRQLRFCQQCTRLEPLSNFSLGRRSCKASLAKRQARAHRGKGGSSPDTSPERGGGARRRAPPPHKASHSSSSEGSGSGSASHNNSGRRSLSSKRSRGESPAAGGAPAAAPPRPPHGAASSAAAHVPSNGSSLMASPQHLAAMHMAHQQQQQQAAAQHAALAAAAQQQAAALAVDAEVAAAEDMLWSGPLVEGDLEELLAMDPGGCGTTAGTALVVLCYYCLCWAALGWACRAGGFGGWSSQQRSRSSPPRSPRCDHPAAADALADALLVAAPASMPATMPTRNHSGEVSGGSQGSHWLPAGARGAAPQPAQQMPMPAAQQWGGGMPPPPALRSAFHGAHASQPGSSNGEPAPPAFLNGAAGTTAAFGAGAGTSAAGAQLGAHAGGSAFGASTSAAAWGAQPAALQAAALQQQAGGVAAGVSHAHPMHVVTRFSLKVGAAMRGWAGSGAAGTH